MNEYTIVQEIGSGSFGKVFEASIPTGENFALKWYMQVGGLGWHLDRMGDQKREFEMGQVLDHPHILKSIESFDEFTVLEFVPGMTLSKYVRGDWELSEAIKVTKQFISAVRYAFIQEYLHLDLHGENIMLNHNQDVKIIDLSSFFSLQEIQEHDPSSEKSKVRRHSSGASTPISEYIVDNFDDVVELCIRILMRAKLSRKERLHIKAELKKIAWTCDLDHQEGIVVHFEECLDLLEHCIEPRA